MSRPRHSSESRFNGYSYLLWSYLLVSALLIIRALSTGLYDSGDAISHFQIAKYAGLHPDLFLDHWGKPLFTLLSWPFAQLGLYGTAVFNGMCAMITLWAGGRLLGQRHPIAVFLLPVLVLSSPEYTKAIMAGTTEPLFAALLVLIILCVAERRFVLAALLTGALPLSRPEAVGIIPIVVLVLLYLKQPRALLYLLVIPLIYSLWGWVQIGDPLWLITNDPYPTSSSIYGSGSLWHFIQKSPATVGPVVLLASGIGLLLFLWRSLKKKKTWIKNDVALVLLIAMPVVLIWSIHSYLWWTGTKGSLGLLRVLVTTIPSIAIILILLFGSLLESFLGRVRPKGRVILLGLFSIVSLWPVTEYVEMPLEKWYDQDFLERAAKETRALVPPGTRMHVQDPLLTYFLGIDPFDTAMFAPIWALDRNAPDLGCPEGEVILWDGHFSPNEGGLPLAALQDEDHFQHLATFRPEFEMISLGDHALEAHLFQRVSINGLLGRRFIDRSAGWPYGGSVEVAGILDTLLIDGSARIQFDTLPFPLTTRNMDRPAGLKDGLIRIKGLFGPPAREGEVNIVYEVRQGEEQIHYKHIKIIPGQFAITVPLVDLTPGQEERLYLWQSGSTQFYMQDLEHEFYGSALK